MDFYFTLIYITMSNLRGKKVLICVTPKWMIHRAHLVKKYTAQQKLPNDGRRKPKCVTHA